MTEFRKQTDMRMPRPGEGWRHYESELYEIIGIAVNSVTHQPEVIYQPYGWSLAQNPPIFASPLEFFLGIVEKDGKFRFKFERPALSDHKGLVEYLECKGVINA